MTLVWGAATGALLWAWHLSDKGWAWGVWGTSIFFFALLSSVPMYDHADHKVGKWAGTGWESSVDYTKRTFPPKS